MPEKFVSMKNCCTFAQEIRNAPRGGAVVARWAHNPKAGGSIPSPATFKENASSPFLFLSIFYLKVGDYAKSFPFYSLFIFLFPIFALEL